MVVLLLASLVVFAAVRALPGDPALMSTGIDASPEAVAAARERLALDRSVPEQYVAWLSELTSGNLGESFATRQPVAESIRRALEPSIVLLVGAVVIGVLFAAVTGTIGAMTHGSSMDWIMTTIVSVLYGMPAYWVGLLAILVFSVHLPLLPTGGYVSPFVDLDQSIRHLIMPAMVLGLSFGSVIARYIRSSLIDEFDKPYLSLIHI